MHFRVKERKMTKKSKEPSDHDLLIELNEKVEILDKHFTNHLAHHWAVTLVLLTSLLGLVATVLKLVVR